MEASLLQTRRIGREIHGRVSQGLVAHLLGGVVTLLVLLDLGLVDVEADDRDMLGKLDGDGHANVAEAHERELGVACEQIFIEFREHFFLPSYSLDNGMKQLPEEAVERVEDTQALDVAVDVPRPPDSRELV